MRCSNYLSLYRITYIRICKRKANTNSKHTTQLYKQQTYRYFYFFSFFKYMKEKLSSPSFFSRIGGLTIGLPFFLLIGLAELAVKTQDKHEF